VDNLVETVDKPYKKQMKKVILGIFAKQPVPGEVKTRLCPPFHPDQAADLYFQLLTETIERMQQQEACDLAICFVGEREWFKARFPGIALWEQRGEDLGERMSGAMTSFFEQGYSQVILIGSDTPDLPLERIDQAITILSSADLVLGPAADGGYYLIGESFHSPELFKDIPWSSDRVLAGTLKKAEEQNISTQLLGMWEDLDDITALQRFLKRTKDGRTARYLKKHLSQYFIG